MELLSVFIISWLVVLTIGGLLLEGNFRRHIRNLEQRTREVDMREQMQFLLAMVDRHQIHKDRAMRQAIERFIAQVEADPITADRMHLNITDLKMRLHE